MAALSVFTYGFTITAGSNDAIDWIDAGTTYAATVAVGDYSPGALAAAIQSAMQTQTGNTHNLVSFDPSTGKFTLTGTATFSLLAGSGTSAATSCYGLLGFTRGGGAGNDKTGAATYTGTAVPTTAPSATNGSRWVLAEPLSWHSPVTAVAETAPSGSSGQSATAASLTMRKAQVAQVTAHNGQTFGSYFGTQRRVGLEFRALLASSPDERANMEQFLDWAQQLKPFAWQPDSTSAACMRLVADAQSIAEASGDFEWLTRSELTYPRLTFIEDTSL